jgi:hypothetical protein
MELGWMRMWIGAKSDEKWIEREKQRDADKRGL